MVRRSKVPLGSHPPRHRSREGQESRLNEERVTGAPSQGGNGTKVADRPSTYILQGRTTEGASRLATTAHAPSRTPRSVRILMTPKLPLLPEVPRARERDASMGDAAKVPVRSGRIVSAPTGAYGYLVNLAAVILLLACSGPQALADWGLPQLGLGSRSLDDALSERALRTFGAREKWAPPPCIGNTCQPRIAIPVPGFEPRIDVRGKGSEFVASTLERMNAGFLASAARAIAMSGVLLEFQPRRPEEYVPKRTKFRQASVMVRMRLDPWNGPVFEVPASP
jgi:hypothetical protein